MANWIKEILMKLYLVDRPVTRRNKKDRRKNDRRWEGPEGGLPTNPKGSRRKKERRKRNRRG